MTYPFECGDGGNVHSAARSGPFRFASVRRLCIRALIVHALSTCMFHTFLSPTHAAEARLLAVELLRDENGSLTASEVAVSRSWRTLPNSGFAAGYSSDTFWVRLRFVGPAGKAGVIFTLPTFLDEVTFFVPNPGEGSTVSEAVNAFETYSQGDTRPASGRIFRWRGFAAPVLFSGTDRDIAYVRVKSKSSVLFWPQIDTQARYSGYLLVESLLAGALILGVLAMCAASAIHWGVHRLSIFRGIAIYAAAAFIFLLTRDGYLSLVQAAPPALLDRGVGVSMCLLLAAAIVFYRDATRITLVSSLLDHVSRGLLLVSLGGAIVAVAGGYSSIAYLSLLLGLAVALGWVPACILLSHRKKALRHPRVLGAGLIGIPIGFIITCLQLVGVVGPSPLAFYSSEISLLVSVLFNFTFTVAESVTMRKEHREAKAHLAMERMAADLSRQAAETHGNWVKIFSHQIKTPLAIITASSRNIERIEPRSEILERTRRISGNAGKIDELVQSLLHIEDIRARLNERRTLPFDALDLARSCLKAAGHENGPCGEVGIVGHGDTDILAIGLSKLIDNAQLHSGARASVMVEVAQRNWKGRAGVVFHVRDSGPPLDEEVRTNMFARHWRGKGSKGHGVGLWAAVLIAEAHGGQVHYERTQFGQNQFSIWIPE
ncbi:7TM-DISM domain-containing protein [Ciceribacter sp. RN22]|uniref:sensor histidine kinase n=1 Tax=Ciceribacter sp. RN22 TaxID=2954932 RepID=UPI002093611A|nr:7TM-DISM domain-containing protein [Ciceribacter sp. RN22]MCO6180965.1 ATP-binding protein [Ciceribacter sp. RN22]